MLGRGKASVWGPLSATGSTLVAVRERSVRERAGRARFSSASKPPMAAPRHWHAAAGVKRAPDRLCRVC